MADIRPTGWPFILYNIGSALSRAGVGSGSTVFGRFFGDVAAAVRPPPPVLSAGPTPGINPTAPSPIPPGPGTVTGEQLFRDILTKRDRVPTSSRPPVSSSPDFERLMRGTYRPPDVRPTVTRATAGSAVSVLARAAGLLGGLLYSPALGDSDLGIKLPETKKGPQRGGPKGPRKRRGRRRNPREPVIFPWLPVEPYGSSVPDRIGRPYGTSPGAEPRPRILPRVPLPRTDPRARPRPGPVRVPTAATGGQSLPFPYVFPFFPLPSSRPVKLPSLSSFTQPLPGASGPIYGNVPKGLTAPITRGLPSPLTAAAPGCPPCPDRRGNRTQKKRKPRTVCYRGEYVEKASGLTKFRKRKIPCR